MYLGVSIRRLLIGWKCGTDWVTIMKKKLRWFGFVCFVYCLTVQWWYVCGWVVYGCSGAVVFTRRAESW